MKNDMFKMNFGDKQSAEKQETQKKETVETTKSNARAEQKSENRYAGYRAEEEYNHDIENVWQRQDVNKELKTNLSAGGNPTSGPEERRERKQQPRSELSPKQEKQEKREAFEEWMRQQEAETRNFRKPEERETASGGEQVQTRLPEQERKQKKKDVKAPAFKMDFSEDTLPGEKGAEGGQWGGQNGPQGASAGTNYKRQSKEKLRNEKAKKKLSKLERRIALVKIVAAMLIIFIVSGIIGYNMVIKESKVDELFKPEIVIAEEDQILFEVPLGAGSTGISKLLAEQGIIRFPFIYKLISRYNGYDGTYKSGTHIISKKLSYREIMDKLSENPEIKRITFPEGMTLGQVTEKLADNGMVSKDSFDLATANYNTSEDYKFLAYLPEGKEKLEGFLFPDTYDFGVKATDKQIIDKMLARFNTVFKPEYYEQAEKMGMSPYQIVILASIIEKESAHSDERKIISSVFYNRLGSKDTSLRKLQSCATIQYILLERTGTVKLKITDEDTSIKSPYNTYLNAGLPPTPICSPSEDSILAALYPDSTDYLYFVAKGDEEGRNEFSKTYQEHLAAKNKYGM